LTTNVNIAPQFNFGQGFDEYTYLEPDLPFFTSRVSRRFAVVAVLYRLRWELYHVYHFPNERYRDAATLNREALAWLEANRQSRFFLFLHYMDPHTPYYAHPYDNRNVIGEEYLEAPDPAQRVAPARQLYGGEVAYLDSYLGELFDQLKAWGLYDDALIVFTGDHGEEFYEHQGWTHGKTLYEEQLRVPLIVKLPGQASANAVAWAPARGLDLAPTVLDVAGIPVPQTMQGVSLWPGAAQPRAEILFAELSFRANTIRSIRQGPRKLIVAQEGNPDGRGLPPLALFDLQADPDEQQNLAEREPDAAQALRAALDQVMTLAASQAVVPQTGELDAATRERMRQLGY